MKLKLAYGQHGLTVHLPETTDVVEPSYIPALPNPEETLLESLRKPIHTRPLRERVTADDTVAIVHTDITRATPNKLILPVLLDELARQGIPKRQITLINGLGTHRKQTPTEMVELLGKEIVDQYRCIQHDPDNQEILQAVETKRGRKTLVHKAYLEADIRILTGFIEPHFFAGFSGGPKSVLPAIAGTRSIHANHSFEMLAHPQATWGITCGNPLWEEMLEVALATKPTFLLNVALNADHHITGVFSGDLEEAHKKGCAFVKSSAMVKVDEPYDIVVTTNSGYPLDLNLYQSVKGISAAGQIVKTGGAIIMAAACQNGLPDGGNYARMLTGASSLDELLETLSQRDRVVRDQWQVQKQINVQQRADVHVYSDGLSEEQIRSALFNPCRDIEGAVSELTQGFGNQTRICVMSQGPQTIPYLKE
jgi:nickel-dependent lactate racemase